MASPPSPSDVARAAQTPAMLLRSRLWHAGMWGVGDLLMTSLFERETPFGQRLWRSVKIGAFAYFAPTLLGAYYAAQLPFFIGNIGTVIAEADRLRIGQATTPGFHTADVFSSNMGQLLTERQRAVQAIQTQIFNARSSIGSEAVRMKRDVRDYLP